MKFFYTRSTKHLASTLAYPQGNYIYKTFSDGELYIKLEEEVAGKSVWVITNTIAPAEHLIELFLLLNALQRAQAKIHLLFTYFAYARQDNPSSGEASSANVICTFLNTFTLEKIFIIHAHSPALHEYMDFKNIVPFDQIAHIAREYDALAAPDQGAYTLVSKLSQELGIESIFLTKIRPEQESVQILQYDGIVKAKKILIVDDIIATGNTTIEVAKTLKLLGATQVSVWATHGIFSGNAFHAIAQNGIAKIYVTNTIAQKNDSSKIEVISIAPLIEQIVTGYSGIQKL